MTTVFLLLTICATPRASCVSRVCYTCVIYAVPISVLLNRFAIVRTFRRRAPETTREEELRPIVELKREREIERDSQLFPAVRLTEDIASQPVGCPKDVLFDTLLMGRT